MYSSSTLLWNNVRLWRRWHCSIHTDPCTAFQYFTKYEQWKDSDRHILQDPCKTEKCTSEFSIRVISANSYFDWLYWSQICGCHLWDRLETSSWKVSGRIIWPGCFLRFSFNSDSPWNRKFFSRGQKGLKSSRKLATYIWNDESFHYLWVLCGKMTSAPPTKCLWSSRGVTLNYTFIYEIQAYHVKSMMHKKNSSWVCTLNPTGSLHF